MPSRDKGKGRGGRGSSRDKRKSKKDLWADNRINRQVQGSDGIMVEERHKGSYNLDELKNSHVYISQLGNLKVLYPSLDLGAEKVSNPFVSLDILLPRAKRKMAVCFGYLGTKYQGLQVSQCGLHFSKFLRD